MGPPENPRRDLRRPSGPPGRVRALLGSCHPAPTVAVTVLAGVLGAAVGLSASTMVLLVLAVLLGQLSIGWSNDWLDATRDVAVGRGDKPVATGAVSVPTVRAAALMAAVAAVPASLLLGVGAGAAHVVAVASGWTYNLGLKATWWSWVPYAVTFGLLPAVVTLALPAPAVPLWWAVLAGALLGLGAHLVNVLPDLDDDAATGVQGLPHRLGRTVTTLLAPAVLLAATLVVVLGARDALPGVLAVAVVLGAVALSVTAAVTGVRGSHRSLPLVATAAVAVLDVAALAAAGSQIVS